MSSLTDAAGALVAGVRDLVDSSEAARADVDLALVATHHGARAGHAGGSLAHWQAV